ncbi:MAG: hypothetical protein H7Y31_08130 [Chitinophagaceae bacterium]|nr:hypothetical protein [Chitinophagaceae bacterium]
MPNKRKKAFRQQVEQQLITTFDLLERSSNPKKVKRGLRKASKILSGLLKAVPEVKAKAKPKNKKLKPVPKEVTKAEAATATN